MEIFRLNVLFRKGPRAAEVLRTQDLSALFPGDDLQLVFAVYECGEVMPPWESLVRFLAVVFLLALALPIAMPNGHICFSLRKSLGCRLQFKKSLWIAVAVERGTQLKSIPLLLRVAPLPSSKR